MCACMCTHTEVLVVLEVLFAKQKARQIIVQCGARILVLSVAFRDATKAAHVGDHEVEMSRIQRAVVCLADMDAERRRLTRVQVWQHC